jgi:hypothetical protein
VRDRRSDQAVSSMRVELYRSGAGEAEIGRVDDANLSTFEP